MLTPSIPYPLKIRNIMPADNIQCDSLNKCLYGVLFFFGVSPILSLSAFVGVCRRMSAAIVFPQCQIIQIISVCLYTNFINCVRMDIGKLRNINSIARLVEARYPDWNAIATIFVNMSQIEFRVWHICF